MHPLEVAIPVQPARKSHIFAKLTLLYLRPPLPDPVSDPSMMLRNVCHGNQRSITTEWFGECANSVINFHWNRNCSRILLKKGSRTCETIITIVCASRNPSILCRNLQVSPLCTWAILTLCQRHTTNRQSPSGRQPDRQSPGKNHPLLQFLRTQLYRKLKIVRSPIYEKPNSPQG